MDRATVRDARREAVDIDRLIHDAQTERWDGWEKDIETLEDMRRQLAGLMCAPAGEGTQ